MKAECENNGKFEEIKTAISRGEVVKIDISHKNKSYEVPLNYGYEFEDKNLILYCDFSNHVKKVDILRENPKISIKIDSPDNLNQFIVTSDGTVEFIDDIYGKIKGLSKIDKHSSEKDGFKNKIINNITLIKITCHNFAEKYL